MSIRTVQRGHGRFAHLLLVASAVSIAALPTAALFATVNVLPVLLGAALAGVAPVWFTTMWRWSALAVLLSAGVVVLFLASLGAIATVGRGGWSGARDVVAGWLHGPAALLTTNLPLDTSPRDMAFVASVVMVTAVVSGALAVRSASSVTPLIPATILFGAGIAIAASTPATHEASAIGFVSVAVAFVIARSAARVDASMSGVRGRTGTLRRMSGRALLPPLLLAVLVPVGVWQPLTGDGDRADPRSLVIAELDIQVRISPLSRIKAQLRTTPPVVLFEVTPIGQARLDDRIRIAALDSYDGVTWGSALSFAAAGHHFFPDRRATAGRTVSARVTIDQLDGVFLPVFGQPLHLNELTSSRSRLGFSQASGTIVDLDHLRPGFTYDVTGHVPDRDASLARVPQPPPEEFRPYLLLPPDVPVEIRMLSQRLTGAEGGPLAKLTAIENHLRTAPYRLDVPAGHSYASILNLLGTPGAVPVGGFAEQRAAAFAVLARLAGIPTRIAVGYRLAGGPTRIKVTTQHAHAWPESYFPGYGWIPFEPTISANAALETNPPPQAGANPQPPSSSPRPVPAEGQRPPRSRPPVTQAEPADGPSWRPLILVELVLPGGLLMVLGQKRGRRWVRRHTGTNADRVRGAWREAMDRLAEHGFRERAGDTQRETSVQATTAFSGIGTPLRTLGSLATSAAFSATPPRDEDVARAWRQEHDLRRALAGGRLITLRAMRTLIDPRPLWRIRVRDHGKGRHTR